MSEQQVTIKIWIKTRKNLRLLYALTGESMVSILDRLIRQELERVRREQGDNADS